ncbi:hypothetical protein BP6252_12574 [Coleophoma cylindrospora]|uniref:Glycosyltransferase family 69 protein n=1 Tax=Coleophoma cylindrospora TaxID=1849047 RepID=A0A3D8QCP3_9HELO|nr:hypothetical protein BP6252_12574 [Coleophoma cylindrospora]
MSEYDALPRSSFDADTGHRPRSRRRFRLALLRRFRRTCRPLYLLLGLIALFFWQITFNTSYTNPPPFEIPAGETVYIAANIIDADLINGAWGDALVQLVELIGTDRVFVSVYGGPESALQRLNARLSCGTSLVAEDQDPVSLRSIPHTTLPTGEERIKRIAFLAEVRNKALEPLKKSKAHYDKILFINDVYFTPEDATRLLWGTNLNSEGRSEYKAVCAADFVTSWKYYDTYGTRDLEGYSIGVPIFPWFANEGEAASRNDVLAGKDAVRVKSCWGGMVSFDAKYFTEGGMNMSTLETTAATPALPLRFRSEPEPFWDASECCLIHADIIALPDATKVSSADDVGIYMNPFVRVAYDGAAFSQIGMVKRFERLFALLQAIINPLAHMPRFNPRRTEVEGQVIHDRRWVSSSPSTTLTKRATLGSSGSWDDWAKRGHYEDFDRVAARGGYCGVRQLLVLKEDRIGEKGGGGGNWDNLLNEVPPLET